MNIDMSALEALEAEESVTVKDLFFSIKSGLLRAYKDMTGYYGSARVDIDPDTGYVTVYQLERDEEGEVLSEKEDTPDDFGRMGAKAVRDAIRSRLTQAHSEKVYEDYSELVGSVVNGVVVRDLRANERGMTIVDLGTEFNNQDGVLMPAEHIPGETLEHGDRVRSYVLSVHRGDKSPTINLSRTHPRLIDGLFKLIVPEIADGSVEVMSVAREAGHRSKVAVRSNISGLNAKGACIGPHGQRVNAIIEELNGEKIDIVDWDADPVRYIGNALAPSKTVSVEILDPEFQAARAIVPDYQLSLAIGKEGQNVRLAARLTGWKIDIRSESEAQEKGLLAPQPAEGADTPTVPEKAESPAEVQPEED